MLILFFRHTFCQTMCSAERPTVDVSHMTEKEMQLMKNSNFGVVRFFVVGRHPVFFWWAGTQHLACFFSASSSSISSTAITTIEWHAHPPHFQSYHHLHNCFQLLPMQTLQTAQGVGPCIVLCLL